MRMKPVLFMSESILMQSFMNASEVSSSPDTPIFKNAKSNTSGTTINFQGPGAFFVMQQVNVDSMSDVTDRINKITFVLSSGAETKISYTTYLPGNHASGRSHPYYFFFFSVAQSSKVYLVSYLTSGGTLTLVDDAIGFKVYAGGWESYYGLICGMYKKL